MLHNILTAACALLLYSCVDVDVEVPDVARPVVQAYLIPGHNADVNIWRESIFLDTDTTIDVDGLTMTIETATETFEMAPAGKGTYKNNDLIVSKDGIYTMRFQYNGKEVSATTGIPPKPENFTVTDSVMAIPTFEESVTTGFPDPLELRWTNPAGKYFLVLVENTEVNPTQINPDRGNRPPFAFRNDPMTGNTYSLRAQSFQYFGRHRVILMEVTADYAALYQSNGTSSINLKTPFTNVTNGLGIFTGVNSDTLMVRVIRQ